MSKTGKRIAACAIVAAAGCGPTKPDWRLAPPRDAGSIGRLEMVPDDRPATLPSTIPTTLPSLLMRQPTTAPAQVQLTIAQTRQWAIANNLELKVAAYSPQISRQTLSAEEARFESTFFANASASTTDRPGSNSTFAATGSQQSIEPGITMPLRTGGQLEFRSPLLRSDDEQPLDTGTQYTSAIEASISQPLLRNAGREVSEYSIRIAGYQDEITRVQSRLEVTRVLAAVDRVYWRLYAARRQLDVRRQQFNLASALLERARRLLAAGQGTDVEVVRAESGVADRVEGIITAENVVRERERELKRLLNEPGIDEQTVVVPSTPPNPVHYATNPGALVDAAMRNRSEMLTQELKLAQQALTINFARNQKLPLLSAKYTYRINGLGDTPSDAYDMTFDRDFEEHTLTLNLSVPIGNDAAMANLRRALLERLQQLSSKSAQALQIRKEVLDGIDQLEAARLRILASRARTILAARTLAAERRQLEAGLRTTTDVLNAITDLADAQSSEISALADYEIAQIDLAFATGTLLGQSRVDWEQQINTNYNLNTDPSWTTATQPRR